MKKIGLVILVGSVLILSGCGLFDDDRRHRRHGAVDIPTDTRAT